MSGYFGRHECSRPAASLLMYVRFDIMNTLRTFHVKETSFVKIDRQFGVQVSLHCRFPYLLQN